MGNDKMINNMKKILIIAATLLFSSISLIGCTTELNVSIEGEITDTQSGKFVKICNKPIRLVYDPMTRIIYIEFKGSNTYGISPYYAPNGLPYKYNPDTNTFEEIEN